MAKVPRRNAAANTFTQARYIHAQTRKGVTTAAGVQAMIESTSGAFKVANLDDWWFFNSRNTNNYQAQKEGEYIHALKDGRLLRRLQSTALFPQLNMLVHLPPNVAAERMRTAPAQTGRVGNAAYFPGWFFCTKCSRLKPLSAWWSGWQSTLRYKANILQADRTARLFTYDSSGTQRPNCHYCYEEAIGKRAKKYQKLEQVRFVLASHNADIMDIPWSRWIKAYRAVGDAEENNEAVGGKIALGQECCTSPQLKYNRSNKLSDLAGINIECESCHDRRTLAGLFNMRYRHKDALYKPLIRSSNSVYYPITYSSLYIPEAAVLKPEVQSAIKTMQNIGRTAKEISIALGLDEAQVQEAIDGGRFLSESAYREREYQYLLQEAADADDAHLVVEDVVLSAGLSNLGIARLIKVLRLKMTSVQTGYTRLGPMDNDTFGRGAVRLNFPFDDRTVPLKAKFTVSAPLTTQYLAGVESFGEGIFIQWDDERINSFFNRYLEDEEQGTRLGRLYQRYRQSEIVNQDKIADERHLAKHVLIHTLSHLLIKELEFMCGYPSSSISERLYCNADGMNGLLIYTIAGAEGSFGGLIEQGNPERFENLLQSALSRATDCNSDPICAHNEAQGVGGLNNAACYSCALISETSCEEFNSFLDRNIVVGNSGFLERNIAN